MPHDSAKVLHRLRAELLDTTGLRLTLEQAQGFCGVERTTCRMMLDVLVDEEFLCVKSDGHYARLTDGEIVRPALPTWMTDRDIARRAYELYLARGCEHGHGLDDWLQAERELRNPVRSTAA
jgi:Protein of unknown function (DUF2934)